MATLAEDYLAEYGGSVTEYKYNLRIGQRIGQAFFNALSRYDQNRIAASVADPFYTNSNAGIEKAIEFLLYAKNKGGKK